MQGERGNKILAARFAEDTTSVLFGMKSFFVGVDFQGATCSLVVIDKMPFPVPSDILFASRCAAIEATYGPRTSFNRLSIPVMAMTLIQGLGRLIRHAGDAGVMAVLDPRLATTGYGAQVARALPPAPRISNVAEARDFLGSL
jgi:ATP-dependent DNA helicase DinG